MHHKTRNNEATNKNNPILDLQKFQSDNNHLLFAYDYRANDTFNVLKISKMKKNESELIRNSKNRILTAKGVKFVSQCTDILAKVKGVNRYTNTGEYPIIKQKLRDILYFLIIDQKKSMPEIKELIKNRLILIG